MSIGHFAAYASGFARPVGSPRTETGGEPTAVSSGSIEQRCLFGVRMETFPYKGRGHCDRHCDGRVSDRTLNIFSLARGHAKYSVMNEGQ